MAYNPNIPASSDLTLQSQQQIRSNYQTINNTWQRNHEPLANVNNELNGMHTVLTFKPQGSDPTTSSTQIGLYTKIVAGTPQLFYRPSSAQTPIQMTNTNIGTGLQSTNPDVYYPEQYTFLPGPFYIAGGFLVNVTNGQTVTIPVLTTIYYVSVNTANARAANLSDLFNKTLATCATNISGNSFKISYTNLPGVELDAYYLVVGI